MESKKRMGRPPKPAADRHTEQVNVRMTKSEKKRLLAEASRLGTSLAALLMRPWREQDEEE